MLFKAARKAFKKLRHINCFYMFNDHYSDSFNIKIVVVWFKNWPQLFKRWINYIDIYLYM